MQVWCENEKAVVRCTYQEKELVKTIGDYKFHKPTATWHFPLRKLVDIIDNLHVSYDPATQAIYDRLVKERAENHAKINIANEVKAGIFHNTEKEKIFISQTGLDKIDLNSCMFHQRQAIELGMMFGSYAFFYEPGLGKSKIAIHLIELIKKPALIIAPLSTLENVWMKEINKWSKLKAVNLWSSLDEFKPGYDVYLINYEQFKKLDKKTNGSINEVIDAIFVDESAKIKNYGSQITKTILSYRNKISHRFCLSGVPAPNNLMEFHGQMAFVNDELLGSNFFRFRNTYFYSTGYGGFIYSPFKGAKEAIMQCISKQAYFVKKEEALELPDKMYEDRTVIMDDIQQKAYDTMLKENILEFHNNVSLAPNELSKIVKLREITGGFVINSNHLPVKISDSKILVLKELIEEIPEERQIIIWIQYHWECNEIKKLLGDDAVIYSGVVTEKEKNEAIEEFTTGKKRFLIAHPRSAGHGLNLQNCCYVIWYSISYSFEEYQQASDRVYRKGQTQKVTYFHLLTKNSIDEVLLKVLNKKENLSNACLNMLRR